MFSKATANFVHHIDPEGSLIHVSRVNNSHKLVPMGLVIKRNRPWLWQKPKYHPTIFTLSDLLQGDQLLTAAVSEEDFLSYEETCGGKISGELDTKAGPVGVKLGGQGSSRLKSCFGKLKKQKLNVKKLIGDSSDRQVNMQHRMVQQMEKRAEVLAVVTEKIFTTASCFITQTKKDQCSLQGVLGLLGILGGSLKVCDSNSIESDSDVCLEIPPGTVIAYSVLELEIKKDGRYYFCLQPGKTGCIEEDSYETSPFQVSLDTFDGPSNELPAPETLVSGATQNGSHVMDLSPLADLPQSTRSTMFERLQETLRDRGAMSYLQDVLEELCFGESFDMDGLSESQKKTLSAILDSHTKDSECGVPAHLNAAHLLVSALEELPDETQSLLGESCPEFLEALYTLVCRLKDCTEPLTTQCLPTLLEDNQTFQQLLSSTGVTLKREEGRLWLETGPNPGALYVVFCLSIQGLYFLSKGLEQ
ncbi:gasdermin-E-like [Halichoeres trimaculatus]|uniref:gasdermin-E-like n=1 Tax=Halichoeres trimaculatus TaxID=147232 RepID=UPI003D9E7C7F